MASMGHFIWSCLLAHCACRFAYGEAAFSSSSVPPYAVALGFGATNRVNRVPTLVNYLAPCRTSDHLRSLRLALLPLATGKIDVLVPTNPSSRQWQAFWGNTRAEKVQKSVESCFIAYGGLWVAWFISFLAGQIVGVIVGSGSIFYWTFAPYLYAVQKNRSFKQSDIGRPKRRYFALLSGRIASVQEVRLRKLTRMNSWMLGLRMQVEDELGRSYQLVARQPLDVKLLRPGMRCDAIVSSESSSFESFLAVSDVYVPSCDIWVGDYPYLQRRAFKSLLRAADGMLKDQIRRHMEVGNEEFDKDDDYNNSHNDMV